MKSATISILLFAPVLHAAPIATANFAGMTATNAATVARVEGANDFLWSLYGGASVDFDIVADDGSPGIGAGNALQMDVTGVSFRGMLGQLEEAVTIPAGETLVLSFSGRYVVAPGNNGGGLRFGFTTAADRDKAVFVQAGTGGSTALELRTDSSPGDGSPGTGVETVAMSPVVSSGASYGSLTNSPFTASLAITRNETDYTVVGTLNGAVRTATTTLGYPDFDSIFIGNGGIAMDLRVDNISVGYPEPSSTWSGLGDDNLWSNQENWVDEGLPAEGDLVLIPASSQNLIDHDLSPATEYAGLIFQAGASAYTLSGNSLSLAGKLRNEATANHIVETPLALEAPLLVEAAVGGFSLEGEISGNHGVTKSGLGMVLLYADSSFKGPITIDQGAFEIYGNQSAADGGLTVSNLSPTHLFVEDNASLVVASGNEVVVGNTTFGTSTARMELYGSLDNEGALRVRRAGILEVSGSIIQSGPMTVEGIGGYGSLLEVDWSGELEYLHSSPVMMRSGTNEAGRGVIRIHEEGRFVTGTGFESDAEYEITPRVILSSGGSLVLTSSIDDLADKVELFIEDYGFIDTGDHEVTLHTPLAGTGSLVKQGTGSLVLTASSPGNPREGATFVDEGTLVLQSNHTLHDGHHVEITEGAKLDLAFNGSDVISSLTLGNETFTSGSFNASTHEEFFSGNGTLVISPSDPFEQWINGFDFDDPEADLSKSGDPDGDGMSNLLEFALNLDPSSGKSESKLVTGTSEIEGESYLTLTLAVRGETTEFSGNGPLVAEVDGIRYAIEGSYDLADFTADVVEINPAFDVLPELEEGWFPRTFRLGASVSSEARGFLRAHASEP